MVKACKKCGMEYPDSDSFCIECGGELEAAAMPKPAKPKPVKSKIIVRTEPPKGLETNILQLQGNLKTVENGLGRLDREIKDLKSAKPPEDMELLKSAVEGTANRIGSINSRIGGISRRLKEEGKHIEGIENIIANSAKKQDIEELKKGISIKFGQRTRAQNEKLEALETEVGGQLSSLSMQFTEEFKSQVGSATRKVAGLEAELQKLVGGLETSMEKKIEGFKTGFNQKVNKSILDLREGVAQKTGIIRKLRENLTEQIRLNEERYAGFESRLKEELEGIDNLKEGLTLQQQEKMKEFQTLLLERIGEIKEHSETIGKGTERKLKDKFSRDMQVNTREIIYLRTRLKRLADFEKELKMSIGSLRNFRDKLGERFNREVEAFRKTKKTASAELEGKIRKELGEFRKQGDKAVKGLGGKIREEIKDNAKNVEGLSLSVGKLFILERDARENIKGLRNFRDKLGERFNREVEAFRKTKKTASAELEGKIRKELGEFRKQGNQVIKGLGGKVREDIENNTKGIQGLRMRVGRLSSLERGVAKTVSELKRIEALQQEGLDELESRLSGRLARLSERFGKNRKDLKALEGLRTEFGMKIKLLDGFEESMKTQEKRNEKHLENMEKLEEDLVLQQQNRIIALEERIRKEAGSLKEEKQAFVSGLGEKLGKGMRLNAREIRRLRERLGKLSAFESEIGKKLSGLEKLKGVDELESRLSDRFARLSGRFGKIRKDLEALGGLRTEFGRKIKLLDGFEASLRVQEKRDKEQMKDIENLGEDIVLHQQNKLLELESRVSKCIDGFREKGEKAVKEAARETAGDIGKRLEEIREVERRVKKLSAMEKGIAGKVEELRGLRDELSGFVKKKELGDLEGVLGKLKTRLGKNVKSVKVLGEDLGEKLEVNAGEIKKLEGGFGEKLEVNARKIKRLGENFKGRLGVNAGGIEKLDRGLRDLRGRTKKGLGKDMKIIKDLDDRFEVIEALRQETQQQMGFLKEFMENLEKRVRLETRGLEKKLDGVSRIQEKEELEILIPNRKNMNRIIKTQVKNEVGGLENRILRKLKSKR